MERLKGKVAFVTGAAGDIGRASAMRMAMARRVGDVRGHRRGGCGRDGFDRSMHRPRAPLPLTLDVAIADQVEAALKKTADEYGRLDVIFNNAGIGGMRDWDTTIAVNLSGVFYGLRYGAPMLAAAGGGAIINTASIAGLVSLGGPQTVEAEMDDGVRRCVRRDETRRRRADPAVRGELGEPGRARKRGRARLYRDRNDRKRFVRTRNCAASSCRCIHWGVSDNRRKSPRRWRSSPATMRASSPAPYCRWTVDTRPAERSSGLLPFRLRRYRYSVLFRTPGGRIRFDPDTPRIQ